MIYVYIYIYTSIIFSHAYIPLYVYFSFLGLQIKSPLSIVTFFLHNLIIYRLYTLPETNIPPEKWCSVSFREDILFSWIWMFPKIGGKPPKLDSENNGKPYEEMDDLGGFPMIFGSPPICFETETP